MKNFPVKNCFGGVDEQISTDMFEEAVGGAKRAEHLQYIWNNSFPVGTEYDRKMRERYYHSKEDMFRLKAKREGYTDEQIEMFLSL
jgi:hypothetical protein